MNNYKYAYKSGFNHGLLDAYNDIKRKNYKKICVNYDKNFSSKLYDIGYTNGYNKLLIVLKNNL